MRRGRGEVVDAPRDMPWERRSQGERRPVWPGLQSLSAEIEPTISLFDRNRTQSPSSVSCGPALLRQQNSTMARSRTNNRDEQSEINSEEHEIEDEDEDEDEEDEEGEEEKELTEYEKQRLKTIEKNKAVLAALRLPALASTLAAESSSPVKSSKGKQPQPAAAAATRGPRRRSERVKSARSSAVYDESGSSEKSGSESEGYPAGSGKRLLQDQEYEPSDEDASQSESEETVHEQEMEEGAWHSCNTPPLPDDIDMDEELALQQALALSLGESPGEAIVQPTASKKGKSKTYSTKGPKSAELSPVSSPTDKQKTQAPPPKPERTPVRKRQKLRNDRLQFTTGEIDSFFSLIDGKGRGRLTLADLEIASTQHDFSWSSLELQDMIQFFDSNHDGMLDVADFRSIAVRCNLIRPEG